MRYIQIIRGAYGYRRDGSGTTITKTRTDPPFEVTDAEAERLIKIKVAKYAATPTGDDGVQDLDDDGGKLPVYDKEMKLTELQEIAKAYGVDASKMRRKDEVITAIESAIAEAKKANEPPNEETEDSDGDPVGDDEKPPSLSTADPEVTT